MNSKRKKLLAFITLKHGNQKRKYTNEPYVNHVITVAKMARYFCRFGWEIGLCHDLIEDTNCTGIELVRTLRFIGYSMNDAFFISIRVEELTDEFTHEAFPGMNRFLRKQKEAQRLHKISYEAQTVKYCDLINNSSSIVEFDPSFAEIYLSEKIDILDGMNKGNPIIRFWVNRVLEKSLIKLDLERNF